MTFARCSSVLAARSFGRRASAPAQSSSRSSRSGTGSKQRGEFRIGNGSIIGRVWDSLFDYQTEVLANIAADDSTSVVDVTLDEFTPILFGRGSFLRGVSVVHRPRGMPSGRGRAHGRTQPGRGTIRCGSASGR